MTYKANFVTSQVQAMPSKVNREVGPRVSQYDSTMASCLRDFTRMNPPMFFGSRSDEDPQDFIDKVYKILYAMGVTSIENAELVDYKLKDVAKAWYTQWRYNRGLGVVMLLGRFSIRIFLLFFFLKSLGKLRLMNSSTFFKEL